MNRREIRLRKLVQKLNDGLDKHAEELDQKFGATISIRFDVDANDDLVCKTSGIVNVIRLTESNIMEYLDDLAGDRYFYNLALTLSEAA